MSTIDIAGVRAALATLATHPEPALVMPRGIFDAPATEEYAAAITTIMQQAPVLYHEWLNSQFLLQQMVDMPRNLDRWIDRFMFLLGILEGMDYQSDAPEWRAIQQEREGDAPATVASIVDVTRAQAMIEERDAAVRTIQHYAVKADIGPDHPAWQALYAIIQQLQERHAPDSAALVSFK